jgi:hypothetical protein
MPTNTSRFAALLIAAALGAGAAATLSRAHAEPEPVLDRAMLERLVRAEEAQAHTLEALVRATERCKR